MGWLRGLLGGASRRPIAAREALSIAAETALCQFPTYTDVAPCGLYTSTMDSDLEITPDGRSRAWRVDFWSSSKQAFILGRVTDGAGECWEKKSGAGPAVVEYVHALLRGGKGDEPEPLPPDWRDTPELLAPALDAVSRRCANPEEARAYSPLWILMPAGACRYFCEGQESGLFAPPPDGTAALMTVYVHEDPDDHDAFLFYVDPTNGELLYQETFRFPKLFSHGVSMDW